MIVILDHILVMFTIYSQVEFPVVSVSAAMGWDSGTVKRELKGLQWSNEGGRSVNRRKESEILIGILPQVLKVP